jgi:WD40 repeat protein
LGIDGRTLLGIYTLKHSTLLGVLCLTLFVTRIESTAHDSRFLAGLDAPDATPTSIGPTLSAIRPQNVTHISKVAMILPSAPVMDVIWSPDGRILAVAEGSAIRLYDVNSLPVPKAILTGPTAAINSIAFSPDGASIASGSDDGTIRIWDILTGRQKAFQKVHVSDYLFGAVDIPIYSVAFSPDGRLLAYGTEVIADIYVWDIRSGLITTFENNPNGFVKTVVFSPDGTSVFGAGGWYTTILSWDLKSGGELPPIVGHQDGIYKLAFDHSGTFLASVGWAGTIMVWNMKLNKRQMLLPELDDTIFTDVSFNQDGTLVACGGIDGIVHFLDVKSASVIMTISSDSSMNVAFNPSGTLVALAGQSAEAIQLWGIK